jgi:NADH:ubiquinone oxidoreductase subunit 5 (subunit L)/multisubunit Na+/H+ antiporter MnhA subunit
MMILMFSMAGVPFFVGFFAKFAVLQAVVAAKQAPLAGGVRRDVLAGRRLLLPARGEGDVLRCADR